MTEIAEVPVRQLVLVDTNCYIRLHYAPLRPILGTAVGRYDLLTLPSLLDEFKNSDRLMANYAWVDAAMTPEHRAIAAVALSDAEVREIRSQIKDLQLYAHAILTAHCKREMIDLRQLSRRDIELLAAGITLKAKIATDEWPLTLVINNLLEDPDDYCIEAITSVHLLQMFYDDKKISLDDCRKTVIGWQQDDEKLLRTWRKTYQLLFSERPPAPN